MASRVRRLALAAGLVLVAGLVAAGMLTGLLPAGLNRALADGGRSGSSSPSASSAPSGATGAGPSGTGTASGTGSTGGTADPPVALAPVLAVAGSDSGVDQAALGKRIAAVDAVGVGGKIGAQVMDLASGRVVYHRSGSTGFTPASTNKLLTTVTALDLLGPDHRFKTTVVAGAGNQIILVGGGDPYLSVRTDRKAYPALPSLQQLAADTARRLKADHRSAVTLGYDNSLFTGPSWNPDWPSSYRDQVSPISALWANEGRVTAFSPGPRVKNPPLEAAEAFAAALRRDGIHVGHVTPARAGSSARRLALLESLPLQLIVEHLLLVSDNDAAEVLFRQAAIAAGRPGSFSGGQQAVHHTLAELGVWDSAARIQDGSGLSRQARVPPDMMVKIIRLAASSTHPRLRPLITGLPIAGVDGTLRVRFAVSGTGAARGLARAKTGTLSQVHALAGYVRTRDGATVAFDLVINRAGNDDAAEIWLQRAVTAIATCGCRP